MKKRTIGVIATVVVAVAAAAALAVTRLPDASAVTYTDAEAQAQTIEQTLTAAGQIKAAETEAIEFSTDKVFSGMCVEEGDAVQKGQHLISYSDGTYEDAPANGLISNIEAPETGSVADEDNTLTLSETDELILEISVPEDEISKLAKGDEAKITVNADSGKTFNGTVTSIKALSTDLLDEAETDAASSDDEEASGTGGDTSGAAGSTNSAGEGMNGAGGGSDDSGGSTAYYAASLELINDGTLKPGMSASCTVTISHRSVLAVPVEAVQFDDDDAPYVETISGSGVEKTPVTTGESDASYVEITEGLSEGDQVRIEVRR